MTRAALRRPFGLLGTSLARVFRDPPSWYEFIVGSAVCAYAISLMMIAQPLALGSLQAILPLLPHHWWAVISCVAGVTQIIGVLGRVRFLQSAAAFGMILWFAFFLRMAWAAVGPQPGLVLIGFLGILPNAFLVARHARDW